MILPLVLIIGSILSAAIMAYGPSPAWAQHPHGLQLIMLASRFQWPMVTLCILLSIALIALVVAGKRRAWFLIGLGPVLALFAHHFAAPPMGQIVDTPQMVNADAASFLHDGDYVVGLNFADHDFAFPYAALFANPVVLQSQREKRMILIWSAYANRALAFTLTHDLKARDLEIVSCPADALLVYDHRLGQFINGMTGLTADGQKPSGFLVPIMVEKTTWGRWQAEHPATQVMQPPGNLSPDAPTQPILPAYPLPPMMLDRPATTAVCLVGIEQPVAVESDTVGPEPLNLDVDQVPVFLTHPAPGGPIVAFDRRLPNDLLPRFKLNPAGHSATDMFIDQDTDSKWSADGTWTSGLKELKGKRLARVPVDNDLYWGVVKFWYPNLALRQGPVSGR